MKHRRRLTRRGFLRLGAWSGAAAAARALGAPVKKKKITGLVASAGKPLGSVRVSDGRSVVATDAEGLFSLELGPHSGPFVFVTTPRGHWTDRFYVPTAEAAKRGRVEFELSPVRQPEKFEFVFWTDMHLEGGGVRLRKFRATVRETNRLRPAFVWAQGDITLQGKAGADYVACISALTAPIRNGAGNHEMILSDPEPRRAFWSLFGPTYYSFDWGGIHCVVLDGNKVVSRRNHWSSVHGFLSERELAWLKNDLAAKPRGVPVVVGIHIPLVTTYSERRGVPGGSPPWIVGNSEEVRAVLAANDTRLVLQGHLHENERIVRDGIEYVTSQAIAGTWWASGEGFERGVDGAPRGFRVVEVEGRRISHRFHSSAESHVEAAGEFLRSGESVRRREHNVFVFNAYDAPWSARVRARVDAGAWKDMPAECALNHRLHLIMPHHFYLEADTSRLEPGKHTIEVEASFPGGELKEKSAFTIRADEKRSVPVIYSTDLFHPHVDPDDHFDLACVFSLPEVDIRAVVLDNGVRQRKRPGMIPVRQMMALTGRRIPVATGLAPSLASPSDDGKSQGKEFQGAVELILKTLRESKERVVVVATGSLRDVAAAYNRDRLLCERKIDRIYAFIGDAHSAPDFKFREYNVTLDVNAYRRIMTSGLPVYWVPCFDGGPWKNRGRASYWRAAHRDLLANVTDRVKQYFIYALRHKKEGDPVAFLDRPVDPEDWAWVLKLKRNLWCCAVFTDFVDRKVVMENGKAKSVPGRSPGEAVRPFTFEHVFVDVDPTGMILYPGSLPRYPVNRFKVEIGERYGAVMTSVTADLLSHLGREG